MKDVLPISLRDQRGVLNCQAKLSEEQVEEIKYGDWSCTQKELASRYGVSRKAINNIMNYVTWRHI